MSFRTPTACSTCGSKQMAGDEVAGRLQSHASVMAVGDDDQSIYAFRGARVGNMADFVREFDVQHQIKLEQNYRSYSNILDSANHLIGHNSRRLGKNLRTTQGAGEPVRVYEASTDLAEAQWMVDEIKQLVRSDGFERKGNRRALPQQRAKPGDRIGPVQCQRALPRVRRPALFERAEIKHALAYLRLLENPNDDTSFCASSTSRRAALARAALKCCKTPPAPQAARCTMP